MELSAWAEQVLYGTTLADKCAALGRPTDARRGEARAIPSVPGRPASLALGSRHGGPVAPMRRSLLETASGRGRVLHAFANHELMALELMALAILRWPDADPAFRRSLARTMEDEQRHLQQYLERMAACGVALGEVPVSGFFWDALAHAPDPAACMAGLSGVLEQANLDFSRYWQAAFAAAGDADTAEVLAEVYRDEVRHVRTGLRWYGRWREMTFASWSSDLAFPLTAARARGPVFDREGRERAGLPAAWIDAVEVSAHSKGRPPRVLWFRPEVELDLAGRTPSMAVRELAADLALVVAADAGADDVVVTPVVPSISLLRSWRQAGLTVPRFVQAPPTPEDFGGRPIGRLEPWGWGPTIRRDLEPLVGLAPAAPPSAPHLASKAWWTERRVQVLEGLSAIDGARCGRVIRSVDGPFPEGAWVAKAPLSASGQARIHGSGAPTSKQQRWLRRTLADQGAVVVEPWWTGLVDMSVQGRVSDAGVSVDGITRFITHSGRYRGTWLGQWHRGLPRALQRFVHERNVGQTLHTAAERVGAILKSEGHRGPFGVDAMLVDDDGPALHALIEVNPRWTMGRVGLALARRVRRGTPAWLWLRSVQSQPVERPAVVRDGLLVDGLIPLGEGARRVCPVLAVGPAVEALAREPAGPPGGSVGG